MGERRRRLGCGVRGARKGARWRRETGHSKLIICDPAVYREASRKAVKVKGLVDEIVSYVAANPGCTISEAKETLTAGNRLKDDAVSKAIALGMVRKEDDPEDKRRKLLYFVSTEAPF